jgi:hypothetical protein
MIKSKGNNNMGVANYMGVINQEREKCLKNHEKYEMIEMNKGLVTLTCAHR